MAILEGAIRRSRKYRACSLAVRLKRRLPVFMDEKRSRFELVRGVIIFWLHWHKAIAPARLVQIALI
jgi:hypothetical protein